MSLVSGSRAKPEELYKILRNTRIEGIEVRGGRPDEVLAELEVRLNQALERKGLRQRVTFRIVNQKKEEFLAARMQRYRKVIMTKEGNAFTLIDSVCTQTLWSFRLDGDIVIIYDYMKP